MLFENKTVSTVADIEVIKFFFFFFCNYHYQAIMYNLDYRGITKQNTGGTGIYFLQFFFYNI